MNVVSGWRNCSASSCPWKISSTRYHVASGPAGLERYERHDLPYTCSLTVFVQRLLYILKHCTSSSHHVISSRRPCCHTSLRKTHIFHTKQRESRQCLAFRLRTNFGRLANPRWDA